MFLEADCNLSSGESLIRQFVFGKRFFKEEFGVDNQILWLPDVFGYAASLPQIMEKCGIHYFMTTKISWSETNKMPYDTFLWEGIDGTRILTHFISTRDYNADLIVEGICRGCWPVSGRFRQLCSLSSHRSPTSTYGLIPVQSRTWKGLR